MEMATMDREQNTLINELTQGRELANQLRNHLDKTTSRETYDFLVEKILSSYEKALSVLNSNSLVAGEPLPAVPPPSTMVEDYPPHNSQLAGSSPRSEASDRDSKDQYCQKDVLKKRKTLPRWSDQVRICSGTGIGGGLDGPLGDGYSWRKYGQKDILGANFPRSYYRCTHRHAQGCLATKQVQRSDEDPSIFEITYRGRHTCIQGSHLSTALASLGKKEEPKQNKDHYQEIQTRSQEMIFNFGSAGLKTENLGISDDIFPSFSFPFFPESLKENNFMGSYSPPFISPETSDSNYFSMSPCHLMNSFGMAHNLQSSDSDLTEIISAQTSVTNSPIGDLDFSLDPVDFETNFPLEILECYP